MRYQDAHPSAAELAGQLASGVTTSVELTKRALTAAREDGVTFITLNDGAIDEAEAADERRRKGTPRSELDGVPTAIKDVIDTENLRTTMASEFFRDSIPHRDAAIVTRLKEAGAIIIGKTNAQEFSYGIRGDSGAFGAVRNPHDDTRVAGGSSSGSAVAVAHGIVSFAVGTDTAGSVRVPAALCGVVGWKPALGEISSEGVFPLSPTFDTVGLFAQSAEDMQFVAAALGLLADETSWGTLKFVALDDVRKLVVDEAAGVGHDRAVTAIGASHSRLSTFAGAQVDFNQLYRTVRLREAYRIHAERIEHAPERFQPAVLAKLLAGKAITEGEYESALAEIDEVRNLLGDQFAEDDVVFVTPTVPGLAPVFDDPQAGANLADLTVIWNVLGWPAISIPVWSEDNVLPQSVQLVTNPHNGRLLLQAAKAVSRALERKYTTQPAAPLRQQP